jgi:GntR family transcriptional repressor for pyruvate dehydrogenase complex
MATKSAVPAVRPRAYELVLDRIEADLAENRLKVGDHVPSERELALDLRISRPAVREALRVLEAWGALAQATGSGPEAGTVLVASPATALTRFLRLHVLLASIGPSDVLLARIALERESARLAAQRATPADLEAIGALVEAMARPGLDAAAFNELDSAFHAAIARATGNLLVAELTIALREAMRPRLLSALRAALDLPAVTTRLRADHHAVYDAIRNGRAQEAVDRVEGHITAFYGLGD